MRKILIIKLGYSETMDSEIGSTPSLGDVLRTTVLLYPFAEDHVTWLVDKEAYPLLAGNLYIKRILIFDLPSVLQLQRERFDTVINLEKVPGICALADSINAWRRYGFRFDEQTGDAQAYDGCEWAFTLCRDDELKKSHKVSWQESLLGIVGATWKNQEYILGYQPKTGQQFDVGFNWAVGSKWPNKAWPKGHWSKLEELLLPEGLTVSWQQGMDNLNAYMDWISSCRLLVTNDSLGLHIALALRKKVVILYGPTNPHETYFYNRGEVIYPDQELPCRPCLQPLCSQEKQCMEFISPPNVASAVKRLLQT